MRYLLPLTICIILSSTSLIAQNLGIDYFIQTTGTGYSEAYGISEDGQGYIYSFGGFSDSIDLDPGSSVDLHYSKRSAAFIQKFDSNGTFIWAKALNGKERVYLYFIKTDAAGNIYIAGAITARTDLDPGPDSFYHEPNGSTDGFILKLNSDGEFQWVYTIDAPMADYVRAVNVDNDGSVYAAGIFERSFDADNSSEEAILETKGRHDVYLMQLNDKGEFNWAISFGSDFDEDVAAIEIDQVGDIYLIGQFQNKVDFDPDNDEYIIQSKGGADAYISKFDNEGDLIWAEGIGGTANEAGLGLNHDDNGNVYLCGYFNDTVDFDNSTSVQKFAAVGNDDVFAMKLDYAGNFVWASTFGGPRRDRAIALSLDYNKNVHLTGFFEDTIDFDPGTGVNEISSNGDDDIFIQKLNNDGEYLSTATYGGKEGDYGYGLINKGNDMLLCGSFGDTVNFEPSSSSHIYVASVSSNAFILKTKELSVSVPKNLNSNSLNVYPNPSNGELNISFNKAQKNITIGIFQISGSNVFNSTYRNTDEITLNFDGEPGTYLVQVISDSGSENTIITKE
ncbi:MAG: T9SS type A sorting domain-containing protein [Bacteroidia bacterium]